MISIFTTELRKRCVARELSLLHLLQRVAIPMYISTGPELRCSFGHSIVMPPPLGAGGIMFSVCPSVRPSVWSLKWHLLTCTWVRWSIRPTVTVLRHARPSVCPSGEVSGHLPENAWMEWSEILRVDVSWAPSELIRLWSWSVDFSPFGVTLT